MKTLVAILLMMVLAPVASNNFFKSRVDIEATNKLIDFTTQTFFPKVLTLINQRLEALQSIFPDKVRIGDFNLNTYVEADADISGFEVKLNDQVANNFDLIVNRLSERSVQLRLVATNLELVVKEISGSLAGFILGRKAPGECSLDLSAKAGLSRLELIVDITVSPDNEVSFETRNFILGTPSIELDADTSKKNLCAILGSLIVLVFNDIAGLFLPLLTDAISPAVSSLATNIQGTIPLNKPFNASLGEGRDLSISPFLATFQGDTSPATYLELNGGAEFAAALSMPAWREGNSYTNTFIPSDNIPDPAVDQLVNMNIGSDGLNSLIEPIWYLIWSNLATEEDSLDSPLCEGKATDSDPCPFPPLVESTGTALNLAMGAVFATYGWLFVRGFAYHVVIDPPKLTIKDAQSIVGTTSARVLVVGRTLLRGKREVISLDADLNLTISIPTYNSSTGVFGNSVVRLPEVEVAIDDLEFLGNSRKFRLLKRIITKPLQNTLNGAFEKGTSFINNYLDIALGRLQFKVPDIPLFYINTGLKTEFEGAAVVGKIPTNETGGYVKFGSNFEYSTYFVPTPGTSVNAFDHPPPDEEQPPQVANNNKPPISATSVYDTRAYKRAVESDEVGISFSTRLTDADTRESKAFILRVLEDGTIEQFDEATDEWSVVPPLPSV